MSENFRDDWKTHMKNVQWFNIKSLINDGLTDGNNVMIFIETEDYQYEIDDVEVVKSLDQNGMRQTVITIKVKK